jgi:hypothetical protein
MAFRGMIDQQRQNAVDTNVMQLNELEYEPSKNNNSKIYVDKFNIKLKEYKDKYATYLKLQESDKSRNVAEYYVKPNFKYIGKDGVLLSESTKDITSCQSLCSANLKCGGINYNTSTQACELQSGIGDFVPGDKNDSASTTRAMEALVELLKVNTELIQLNDEINDLNANTQPPFHFGMQTLFETDKDLFNHNQSLRQEREKIRQAMIAYNDVDTEYINRAMDVEQHYAYYNVWFVVMVILICVLLSMILFPGLNGNLKSKSIWTAIIITIIVATLNLNNPIAFSIWLLLICVVLAIKANVIPSF